MSFSRKLRSRVGATGSRYSYPQPSFAADSTIVGKFMRTSLTRLPGISVIQGLAASSLLVPRIGGDRLRDKEVGEGMADESRVHTAVAVKLFFEGENHECFGDVFSQQLDASLPPGPNWGQT